MRTLNKIELYINRRFVNFYEVVRTVATVPIIVFVAGVLLSLVYKPTGPSRLDEEIEYGFAHLFMTIVVSAPIIEEIIFRFPLWIFYKRSGSVRQTILIAACVSVYFGWLHGGLWHVFVQGLGGFMLSILFLKGTIAHRSPMTGLLLSISTHASLNGMVWLSVFLHQ